MSDGPMIGRLRLGTFVLSEARDTVYDGSRREDNPLNERTSITVPIVSVDYRITMRFGVQALTAIPLIARTGVVHRATGDVSFRDEVRGFDDTVIGGWYRGGSPLRWNWTLNAGRRARQVKPARLASERKWTRAVSSHSRLQRGSGTVDPILGVALERPLYGGQWVTSLAARLPVADKKDGLRVGVRQNWLTGWAHVVRTHRVMAYGRVDWLHRQQDVFQGTPVLVGGGNWFYLTPGLAVMVGKGVNVQADVKLPVYRHLANRQLDSHAIWQFGVSRSF